MPEYLGKHLIGAPQYLMVPESKDTIPRALEDLGTSQVVLAGVCVLPAIELNNQSSFDTGEISDETDYRVLAAETQSMQPPVSQVAPQAPLGVGAVVAQGSGALSDSWQEHTPSRPPPAGRGRRLRDPARIWRRKTALGDVVNLRFSR